MKIERLTNLPKVSWLVSAQAGIELCFLMTVLYALIVQ